MGVEPVPRAWKAPVQPLTPRPPCGADGTRGTRQATGRRGPRQATGRRASVGTWPSLVRSAGDQGPNQLSSPPSSVTTEPDNAVPSGVAASRAISHPYSSGRAPALDRNRRGGGPPQLGGV